MSFDLFGIVAGIVRTQARETTRGSLRDEIRPPLDEWTIYQQDVRAARDLGHSAYPPGQAVPGVLAPCPCQPLPVRP
ncbi:hypothetical protein [Deinococcus planocerae]|uniref:hypothetical protein n=1 Tax=Deinococcus planocerae TaxID=1737569 RepID=UPI000C7F3CCF|nr:hypothetical protein [Deinococcus planocerae]